LIRSFAGALVALAALLFILAALIYGR